MTGGDVARLAALGAATVGESGGRPLHPRIRPVWAGAALAAPAYTVRCGPGDNLAIHLAVTVAPAASVLVVDAHDVPALGYWGEVLTTAALARGLVGLVIDGGVRDVAALERRRFPVFSALVALPGASKQSGGAVGGAVVVGGAEVATGDWIVGDVDGVAAVPAAGLEDALARGEARARRETEMFARLEAGATTLELLGLDPSPVERHDPG